MRVDPVCYGRRSIRLPGYDYRAPGAYFITICIYERQLLFDDPRAAEQADPQAQIERPGAARPGDILNSHYRCPRLIPSASRDGAGSGGISTTTAFASNPAAHYNPPDTNVNIVTTILP